MLLKVCCTWLSKVVKEFLGTCPKQKVNFTKAQDLRSKRC